MAVYLLHFHDKISDKHTTQHYVGYAKNLSDRIHCHETNPDARLLQVAKEREIAFVVSRTWKGGRQLERRIKSRKNAPKLCPICNPNKAMELGNY